MKSYKSEIIETNDAMKQIYALVEEFPKILKPVFDDFSQILQYPERYTRELGNPLVIKIGENTVWSFKWFLKQNQETGEPSEPTTMTEAVRQHSRKYMYTGNWHRCDKCGELALCTGDILTMSCKCIACKSKEFVERSCDRSQNLDAPIMQAYLNEGVINPCLSWVPERFGEKLKEPFQLDPRIYAGSDSATVVKIAKEPKEPFPI